MAPSFSSARKRRTGFPRPRGDGPWRPFTVSVSVSVPPPTRGWSLCAVGEQRGRRGSPAHAGMAPFPDAGAPGAARFPRPRGDGPDAQGFNGLANRVPPPTRGWPPEKSEQSVGPSGSPAHAGMAPNTPARSGIPSGFPRPRGDGPGNPQEPGRTHEVPPSTRGWPDYSRPAKSNRHGTHR